MPHDEILYPIVRQAINHHPPRVARVRPSAGRNDTLRAEGAYRAYLHCLALALGGSHPTGGGESPDDIAAWQAVCDALDTAISRTAATLHEPDYGAALQAVYAVADAHGLRPQPQPAKPMTMQQRLLAAVTDRARRAGHQVTIQPEYANTGRVYITAGTTFTTLVQLSYDFQTDSCSLHFRGPGIDALGLRDSPPKYRYEPGTHGPQLSYLLRYADGDALTAMLDLLGRALTGSHTQP